MDKDGGEYGLFHWIAPIYGLFYSYQKRHYNAILDKMKNKVDLSLFNTIIDTGCGTGALCSVLNQRGLKVTGVEQVQKMLDIASKKEGNKNINFIQANILEGIPVEDKSFNVSIASFVAHGLKENERKIMYKEMRRITKDLVIIYDYNKQRYIPIDIVEWLEGGDYFNFIEKAYTEMKESFDDVQVINVSTWASWYIGVPTK
ncbi:MAG: class I SAM-dependent methyltransferase [Bacillota bacterium]